MNMKKIMLVLIMTCSLTAMAAHGQETGWSAAGQDSIESVLVNPAFSATGYSSGIGLYVPVNINDFSQDFSSAHLLINFNYWGLSFDWSQAGLRQNYYFAFSPITNVYTGFSFDFIESFDNGVNYRAGLLFRPHDGVSAGYAAFFPDGNPVEHRAGVAVRPFGFLAPFTDDPVTGYLSQRFSLNYDVKWTTPEDLLHYAGLDMYLSDYVRLRGNYNILDETLTASLSLTTGLGVSGSYNGSFTQPQSGWAGYEITAHPRGDLDFSRKGGYAVVNENRQLVETPEITRWGVWLNSDGQSIYSFVKYLESIASDNSYKGVVLKNFSPDVSRANYTELQRAFKVVKDSGKKIIFYFDHVENTAYGLAAAVADKIYLHPQGAVVLNGYSLNAPYLGELLQKAGINAYVLKTGDYKNAYDFLKQNEMNPEEREAYTRLIQTWQDLLEQDISRGRGDKLTKSVEALINEGPYLISDDAYAAGLVDGVLYEDQLRETIQDEIGTDVYFSRPGKGADVDFTWSREYRKKIAVVYAVGTIHRGEGIHGSSIGEKSIVRSLTKAFRSPDTGAVLIRVDSGGGSAFASDVIAHTLKHLMEEYPDKPVAVSMGGMAGSGGYYISAYAGRIFAEESTLTGSIGVVGVVFNINEFLAKNGITFDGTDSAENSNFLDAVTPVDEKQLDMVKAGMIHKYERFLDVVAEGREMELDTVRELADGRIYTGRAAFENGLVDEIGGMKNAINWLNETAGLENSELWIVKSGRFHDPLETRGSFLQTLLLPEELSGLMDDFKMLYELSSETGLYVTMPRGIMTK